MPLVLPDRVKETTSTTGTGTITLAGTSSGFQSFAAVGNANTTYYCIAHQTANEWEVGIGTYTLSGTTLARNTVLSSSNAGALVNFSAGVKDAFVTYPATRSIYADGTVLQTTNSAVLPIISGGTGATTAATARTNFGATTVGANLFTLANPTAIRFLRVNADNTVSALDAATFRTAIGAGTSSTTGTVTSVGGTGTVSGLSLSGTVTTSGNLTLGGTLAVLPSNFASQTAKTVLAAPNAAAGAPTFRLLVASDIPELTLANLPGAAFKQSVRCATTANITLSGTQTIDGIAVVAADRVLVKNQTTAAQNGIYVVAAGAWTRSLDADAASEIGAAVVNVDSGTANGGELWTTTFRTTDTLGTTAMNWFEVIYNSGTWAISTSGTAAISTAATVTTSATASAFKVPFANTTVSTTGNYGLLQDSEATFTYNPSTNTLVAGTFSGALSGTAAISTAATVTTSTTASAFKVPFANTTASTTGNYGLLQDSTATFTYNPSTNTLVVGTVSGALSGTATSATNIAGGAVNRIPVQSGAGATTFVVAPTTGSTFLQWTGSAFAWAGAAQAGAGGAIVENTQTIAANYTLTTNYNGMSAGPITINSGVTVTVPSGASWVIV
jgi:hypothetical protein